MRLQQIKMALTKTYQGVDRYHMLQMAAAMSYYFVISLFPALLFLSGILAYIPIPDLFNQTLHMTGRFLPADEMSLVQKVLADVTLPNRGAFLSFGLLGTVWTASGGLAATIEALNIVYHVEETRPFWKTRPLAVALSFVLGFLLLSALAVITLGPNFGEWLANRAHWSRIVAVAWPFIYWTIAVGFTTLAVELLYFWAPNVKQRFGSSLPGAVLAVVCWVGLSYGMGIYFRNFAHLNKTYGVIGAVIGLMIWLYWISLAMLVGAELNAELAKQSRLGPISRQEEARQ
jgi:membrane protein